MIAIVIVSIFGVILLQSDCANVSEGTVAPATTNTLQCYQCNVDHNSLCTDKDLLACPNDQAYDRCLTRISKTASEFTIEKKCALAPCTLRDREITGHLGFGKCDRSASEYDCITCCKENGCNKDAAVNLPRPSVTIAILLAFLNFLTLFLSAV